MPLVKLFYFPYEIVQNVWIMKPVKTDRSITIKMFFGIKPLFVEN